MVHDFETEDFPVIRAANYTDASRDEDDVRVIVVHSTESPEKEGGARAVANYFSKSTTRASAHYCIDNKEIIQCVWDSDVAWAAPGNNHDGLQLELVGTAHQSRAQWLDAYSKPLLENAAKVAAQLALKFHIPVKKLSNNELANGERGFIGHVQASEVYKRSSHWDPGPNFPWDHFINRVKHYYAVYDPDQETPEYDYEVAVVYDGDVDEGIARVLGWYYLWAVLPVGHSQTVEHAVLVGKAASQADQYDNPHIYTGANRDETAKIVAAKIKRNERIP